MSYSTDPAADADQHEQAAHDNTREHAATLERVTAEIRAAFDQHFAGKPGVYIPSTTWCHRKDVEHGEPAHAAIDSVVDYPETNKAFHRMLICGEVEPFRKALVARYIHQHAADIVEARCGLYVPTPSAIPKHIAEMAVSA